MASPLLDTRQMQCFLAVAEELNFTRAAKRLHMSQPPLTRLIKGIEAQVGTVLFLRKASGVELTDAGQVLLEELPPILAMSRQAQERAQMAGCGLVGTLHIGVTGSPVLNLVPRFLIHMKKEMPGVTFVLHANGKLDQMQGLNDRRISLGFTRVAAETATVVVEKVFSERLFVAIHESSPLVGKAFLTLRDLEDQALILYPNIPLSNLSQSVRSAFLAENVRLNVNQMVDDVVTSVALVACGFGSSIVAESAKILTLPGVTFLPLMSNSLADIELSCIYRRDDSSSILAAFLRGIRSYKWGEAGQEVRR